MFFIIVITSLQRDYGYNTSPKSPNVLYASKTIGLNSVERCYFLIIQHFSQFRLNFPCFDKTSIYHPFNSEVLTSCFDTSLSQGHYYMLNRAARLYSRSSQKVKKNVKIRILAQEQLTLQQFDEKQPKTFANWRENSQNLQHFLAKNGYFWSL